MRKPMRGRRETWIALGLGALASAAGCAEGGGPRQIPTARTVARAEGDPRVVAGALLSARAEHTATHLGEDLVLVAGGATLERAASDTAEVLDARTGERRALPARMTSPRAGHAALLLPDGGVLLVGGRDEEGRPLDSCERWDPQSGAFERMTAALAAPSARVAAARQGRTGVFVGAAGLEVWDLERLERLRLVSDLGGPRPDAQLAFTDPDRVLCVGGDLPPVLVDVVRGRVEPFPERLPAGGTLVAAPAAEGALWVVGGRDAGRPRPSPVRYDLAAGGAFADAEARQPALDRPAAASTPERVYVAGGEADGQASDALWALETSTGRPLGVLSGPRRGVVAVALTRDHALFCGGYGPDGRPSPLYELVTRDVSAGNPAFAAAILAREDLERRLAELERLRVERDRARAEADRALRELLALEGRLAAQRRANEELAADRDRARRRLSALEARRDARAADRAEASRLRGAVADLERALAAGRQRVAALAARAAVTAPAPASAPRAGGARLPAPGRSAPRAPGPRALAGTGRLPPSVNLAPADLPVRLRDGRTLPGRVSWSATAPRGSQVELQYTLDGGRTWNTFQRSTRTAGTSNRVPTGPANAQPNLYAIRALLSGPGFRPVASPSITPR